MNDISPIDNELLDRLKEQIEQMAGLSLPDSWGQKDYEFLTFFIEEKSGVKISLTTIKRIWRKEFNRLPHVATLDALSQIVYSKDWMALKLELAQTLTGKNIPLPQNPIPHTPKAILLTKPRSTHTRLFAITGIILVIALLVFKNKLFKNGIRTGDVQFSAKTSVDNAVPNSVVFTYNIDSVNAKKIYIQQSWDPKRRVEITKGNYQQTDIYYLPGYYMAKIIADDSIIREIPVHIKTDNWVIAAHQHPIENKILPEADWVSKDIIGVNPYVLAENKIDLKEPFMLTFHQSKDFNIDGNNFAFKSAFKMDSTGIVCPAVALLLKGEYQYMYINLSVKGCESDIKLSISNRKFDGKKTDLTAFGTNIYNWQNIRIRNRKRQISIELNNQKLFETPYEKHLGKLKEIGFIFKGNGIIKDTEVTKL